MRQVSRREIIVLSAGAAAAGFAWTSGAFADAKEVAEEIATIALGGLLKHPPARRAVRQSESRRR